MNHLILHSEIQEFIYKNLNSDIQLLVLKGFSFPNIENSEVITQIEAKKRCKTKLPTWFSAQNIYYPNALNIEQTSSEITAKYKSELINGASIIDLTGGFGVDCLYFSKRFKTVKHCEINTKLSEIVNHNYKQLYVNNVETLPTDGIAYLKGTTATFDWIYIDPSRRHDSKGKVFFLNDCLPNVPEHLNLLFKHSDHILIKTSPLLDISSGIAELQNVSSIHVVAIHNEVKELLWVLTKGFLGDTVIKTINIKKTAAERFEFVLNDEKNQNANYSTPLKFLYEPNAAILKAGAFNQVAQQLPVLKLHKHSHLYTSDTLIDFPGRIFKIKSVVPYSKKALKRLPITRANITTRNFPETVSQLRQKTKIKDGGDTYLFFTTNVNNSKLILITEKL